MAQRSIRSTPQVFHVYRIDPQTGHYGVIINSYREIRMTNAMDAAIRFAKSEHEATSFNYVVSTGHVTVFDTRNAA